MHLTRRELHHIPGKKQVEIAFLLASDLFCFALAIGFVSIIRYFLYYNKYPDLFDPQVMRTIQDLVIFSLVILAARGLYPGWNRSSVAELKQVVEAITLAYIITALVIFVQGSLVSFSRSIFFLSWFFVVIILPVGRFLVRKEVAKTDWWGEPVVITGLECEIRDAYVRLIGCQRLGIRPVIGLAVDPVTDTGGGRFKVYPFSEERLKAAQDEGIQTNVLAISTTELRRDYPGVFKQVSLSFRRTIFILDKDVYSIMMAQPVDLAGQPAIISSHSLLDPPTRLAKQVTEFVLSLVLVVPTLLLGSLLALLIKLDSPGPIFYAQERVGMHGRKLRVMKFRTMVCDADHTLDMVLRDPALRQEWEMFHKLTNDPRITRVGRWMRKFSLDELPQFINVLRGEMTLIGPRPLVQEEIDEVGEAAATILHVRPGITGWWQVMGRNNLSFEERTRLDLYYVYNWSLWLDLFIFIKTFWVIVTNP